MDLRRLTRELITAPQAASLAELRTLVDPNRLPTDPAMTAQLVVDLLRSPVKTYIHNYWGLFDGDRAVGYGAAAGPINAENSDIAEIGVWVHPAVVAHGAQRLMFDTMVANEHDLGRTRFFGWGVIEDAPTSAFWEDELGYTLAYDERVSRCDLTSVDPELMASWVERARERADGYHLEYVKAPFPDRLIGYLAQALEAMNDAPLDDLQVERETFDAGRAREFEELQLATRSEYRAIIAIETSTAALAGFTALRIPDAEPELSHQGDTVTVDSHRNRGIGRWIKAAMWTWLRQERPDVRVLDTGNAESNRPMLAINEAMGFRDVLHHGVWHQVTG